LSTLITPNVLDILASSLSIDSARREVRITRYADKATIEAVAEVFRAFGARWKGVLAKGTGRYVFPSDPAPLIDMALATGEVNPNAFFSTTEPVADYLAACLDLAALPQDAVILEPNYGTGSLVRACCRKLVELGRLDVSFVAVERNPGLVKLAGERKLDAALTVCEADFMTWQPPRRFDACIMNPPFSVEDDPDAYISHIVRAWTMLTDTGRLAALTPPGWTFRDRGKQVALPMFFEEVHLSSAQFRLFGETYGHYRELRDGLFKDAGTGIAVVALLLGKTMPEQMAEPPADLAKPKKVYQEPEYEDPRVILMEVQRLELEGMRAMANLARELGGLFGDESATLCTGCTAPVGEDGFLDGAGRLWHVNCVRLALASCNSLISEPAEMQPVMA